MGPVEYLLLTKKPDEADKIRLNEDNFDPLADAACEADPAAEPPVQFNHALFRMMEETGSHDLFKGLTSKPWPEA